MLPCGPLNPLEPLLPTVHVTQLPQVEAWWPQQVCEFRSPADKTQRDICAAKEVQDGPMGWLSPLLVTEVGLEHQAIGWPI